MSELIYHHEDSGALIAVKNKLALYETHPYSKAITLNLLPIQYA